MPHVFAMLIAGAGLYAGYRWIAGKLSAPNAKPPVQGMPKDLGALERDPKSGVYRPRAK